MKKYIITLSLAIISSCGVATLKAEDVVNDTIKENLIQLPYGKLSKDRLVGSVNVITSEELQHTADYSLESGMIGKSVGLQMSHGGMEPMSTWYSSSVRGLSRGSGNSSAPLVIIDGLSNRSLSTIPIEEVESIEILKDVTAKMLYGSKAANGVIVVTTKRGIANKKEFSVSANYGFRMAEDYPEFLSGKEDARFTNMASKNDGNGVIYSDSIINLIGTNNLYPDVDFYDEFVNDNTSYKNVNIQMRGGTDKTRYFFNVGYITEDGIEAVGDKRNFNRLNVRSNLDYDVNDVISVNLDIAARYDESKGSKVTGSSLFSSLSKTKAYAYPLFVSSTPQRDSLAYVANGKNLYGEMAYSGYKRSETAFVQNNFGMNFDFNQYVKGLSAKASIKFDVNNYIVEGKNLATDDNPLGYRTLLVSDSSIVTEDEYKAKESKFADNKYINFGGSAQLDYNRSFGNHAIIADLNYSLEKKSVKYDLDDANSLQDDKTMNFGLRLNYAYKNRYVVEYDGSYMGSNKFYKDERWKQFNSYGASYIISNEDFMNNLPAISYLKLKASYGKMGYDNLNFDYLLYKDFYTKENWSSQSTAITGAEKACQISQLGNKNLTYEEDEETNIGMDIVLFNKLSLNAEYFNINREGIPTQSMYSRPSVIGGPRDNSGNEVYVVDNVNSVNTEGYEFTARYSDMIGNVSYSIGGSFSYNKSKYKKYDELNEYSFMNVNGSAPDAIWGFESDGFYTSVEDINSYGSQTLEDGTILPLTSTLGSVIPGDLKYKDLSDQRRSEYRVNQDDDNTIDYKYDKKVIGNSKPRYNYTLDINLKYKNFSLYALGQGNFGFDRSTLWPTYFTNKGDVKYSSYAYKAAQPIYDQSGQAIGVESGYSLPRLTASNSAHSYYMSDFWIQKGYMFKLRTIELDYSIPTFASLIKAQKFGVYLKANDVFTISDLDDLDPENTSAGLTTYPMFTTVMVGLRLTY